MKAKHLNIVCFFSLIVFSALWSINVVQAKPYKFRFAHAASTSLAEVEVGLFIQDRLNKETNGQIQAIFYHSGKMGGEVELFGKLQKGVLQGSFISSCVSSNYGPIINTLTLPFIFPSLKMVDEFRKSSLFDDVLTGLKEYGLTGLGLTEFGWYSIASIKPVSSFDDVQKERCKIRVPKSNMMVEYCNAMGLRPTPIPFPEVYSALQQGVIDGLETSPEVMGEGKFDEVVKSIYLTRHFYGAQLFWTRDDFLKKLPDDLRKQFVQIVKEELEKSIFKARNKAEGFLASFKKEGIEIFELKEEDRAKFVKSVLPVHEKYESIIGKDYLTKVYKLTGFEK